MVKVQVVEVRPAPRADILGHSDDDDDFKKDPVPTKKLVNGNNLNGMSRLERLKHTLTQGVFGLYDKRTVVVVL